MPIGPSELKKITEDEKQGIKKAFEIIDNSLKTRFNERDIYIATSVLPSLNGKQRNAVIEAYLKAGWNQVRFDSDRDGSYLYIAK